MLTVFRRDWLATFAEAAESFVPERTIMRLSTRVLAEKIVAFGEKLAGITLYSYQRSFALCVVTAVLLRNGWEPSALYARQSGKSEVVAIVGLACSILLPCLARAFPDDERVSPYATGFRVGVYGPKRDKAEIVYRRVRKYADSDRASEIYQDPEINMLVTQNRGNIFAWNTGSTVGAFTASETVDNEGETWELLIIDEAQKMSRRKIDKELRPMLASSNGPLVMIGTAAKASAYFRRVIRDNIDYEEETNNRLHFEYPYDTVVAERRALYEKEVRRFERFQRASPKRQAEMLADNPDVNVRPNTFHLQYEKYVERELRKMHGDENDPSFKMNFRLCWAESTAAAIDEKHFYSLAVPNLELNMEGVTGHVVAGLDVAKGRQEGRDQSVLTIYHVDVENPIVDEDVLGTPKSPVLHYHKTIVGLYAFRGAFEWDGQYRQIVEACQRYPTLRMMYVDSTGMGDPVTERLAVLMPWMHVEGFKFSTTSKSNGYKRYLTEINSSRIFYAAGDDSIDSKEFLEFAEQHVGLQRVIRAGMELCEAESDEHDDYPDSGMLGNMAVEESLRMETPMQSVESTIYGHRRNTSAQFGEGTSARAERYRRGRMGTSRRVR